MDQENDQTDNQIEVFVNKEILLSCSEDLMNNENL